VAHTLVMPRQGNTVESCILTHWRKAEGQSVTAEEILCEVETDKAAFEVPAGTAGIVLKILAAEGDDVPVLQPIAVIGAAGEDWKAAAGVGSAPTSAPAAPAAPAALAALAAPGPRAASETATGISPRARALAADKAVDAAALAGSGPGGRVIERDVRAAIEGRPPLSAAVLAAARAGTALPVSVADSAPAGSGLGGRLTLADLAAPPRVAVGASAAFPGPYQDSPVKGIRKLIADRMVDSLQTTAQLSYQSSAPAARLQELRARMKAAPEALGLSRVTINDLVLFAVSRVLVLQPAFNAHKLGESLRSFERVHLGMAVDTPRGLMVPVIRNADMLSLAQISAESKRLTTACLEGKIQPDELSGSTFTVTNLGSLGIEAFTPVLNAPEVAILGVCNIILRPVVDEDGSASFEPRLGLSLTANHQVIDGAPAARFLKALSEVIADIDLWLSR